MILYDMDFVEDRDVPNDFERFCEKAREFGIRVKWEPAKKNREYRTFTADGPKEALRYFLAAHYCYAKDNTLEKDADKIVLNPQEWVAALHSASFYVDDEG